MVQTYKAPDRHYDYSFELIMIAYEKRFPTCPDLPQIASSEIVKNQTSADGNVTTMERKFVIRVDLPRLLKRAVGMDPDGGMIFVQRNILNRRERTMRIDAWNETFSTYVDIHEECVYRAADPTSTPQKFHTMFEQLAKFHLKTSIWGFEKSVERCAINAYAKSIKEAKELLLKHIQEIAADGITEATVQEKKSAAAKLLNKSIPKAGVSPKKQAASQELIEACRVFPHPEEYAMRFLVACHFNGSKALTMAEKAKRRKSSLEERDDGASVPVVKPVEKSTPFALPHSIGNSGDGPHTKYIPMPTTQEFLEKFLPACIHPMRDADDDLIIVFKIEHFNLKQCWKVLGPTNFARCVMEVMETFIVKGEGLGPAQTLKKVTVIADFDGLTSKHLYRPGLQMIMDVFDLMKLCYPEFLKLVVCTRCPRIFPVVWLFLTPFIEESTREKIKVHTENDDDTLEEIVQLLGLERLPDFLDGPFELKFPYDKSFESNSEPLASHFNEISLSNEQHRNLYKNICLAEEDASFSITVGPDFGILTWDFEIMSNSVVKVNFVMKRHGETVKEKIMGVGCSCGTFPVDGESVVLSWTNQSSEPLSISFFCQVFTRDKFDGSMESLQSAISSETPSRSSLMMFNTSSHSFQSK